MDWEVQELWMLIGTVVLGGILMYLFNALTGPGRLTWLRDQLTRSIRRSREGLGPSWRNTRSVIQSRRLKS
ncbi:MAG: hypothetical protein K0S45_4024 [Nitrospira sp.]|jgi:hypothetical protein|nr:hypothetical protein [Nitrospira sp.]